MAETYQTTPLDAISLSLIDFYKQNLSGKSLFKDKHCSFDGDTCSTYGKRIIESRGTLKGYGLIRKRMGRCRDYKIFAFDGQTIGWEKGFQKIIDHPTEENIGTLLEGLHSAEESPACIGHILKGSQTVYRYVYDQPSVVIAQFIESEGVQQAKAKVRNARDYRPYLQKQLVEKGIPIIGAELLTLIEGVPDGLIHVGVALYTLNAVRTYRQRVNFFENFKRWGEMRN